MTAPGLSVARPRQNRAVIRAVGLAASSLIALLAAEGVVRVVAPQVLQTPMFDHVDGLTVNRPNVRGRSYVPQDFDTTITTNSMGLRGSREYTITPQPGIVRILTLGDSLTWGTGADDTATYPAQLERTLRGGRTDEPQAVEVLNAGVGGTGTGEQAIYFANRLARLRPRFVVLGVYYNDVYDDRQGFFVSTIDGIKPQSEMVLESRWRSADRLQGLMRATPGYWFLTQHSHLLNLARFAAARMVSPSRASAPDTAVDVDREVGDVLSAGLPLMSQEIEWLQRRVQDADGRLLVVCLPPRGAILDETTQDSLRERLIWRRLPSFLAAACRDKNIPFVDLTPAMRVRARAGRALSYRHDFHPTPAGYEVIAAGVATLLEQVQAGGQ